MSSFLSILVVILDLIMVLEEEKLFIELEPGCCPGTSDHEMIKSNMSKQYEQLTIHNLGASKKLGGGGGRGEQKN